MNLVLFSQITGKEIKEISNEAILKAVKKGQISEQQGQQLYFMLRQVKKSSDQICETIWSGIKGEIDHLW